MTIYMQHIHFCFKLNKFSFRTWAATIKSLKPFFIVWTLQLKQINDQWEETNHILHIFINTKHDPTIQLTSCIYYSSFCSFFTLFIQQEMSLRIHSSCSILLSLWCCSYLLTMWILDEVTLNLITNLTLRL